MKVLWIAVSSVVIVLAILTTFIEWKRPSSSVVENQDYERVLAFLQADRPDRALEITQKYRRSFSENPQALERDWLGLTIHALGNCPHGGEELVLLWQNFPKAFDAHEDAVLVMASHLLSHKRFVEYHNVHRRWKDRTIQPEAWFVLDADRLVTKGKREKAIEHLQSQSFEGSADTVRLVRLALLTAKEDLNQAWEFLNQAVEKDPTNGNIRLFRAQILEGVNQLSMARDEYGAALEADPHNLQFIDYLGEFYRRQGLYSQALQTWRKGLELPHSEDIWLKAWFWSHVVQPIDFDWLGKPIPKGSLKPLIEFIVALPQGRFWDDALYQQVEGGDRFLNIRQETFWLRVLDALARGNERRAKDILAENPFEGGLWDLSLATALADILQFRKKGTITAEPLVGNDALSVVSVRHHFFEQLMDIARSNPLEQAQPMISEEMEALLHSNEAFAAALLAEGWLEAALQLHALPIIPSNFPDWLAYGLTQAMQQQRDSRVALEFANKQKSTPTLSLLIGELLIQQGSVDQGIQELRQFAQEDSGIGFRAAWLIAMIEMERKHYGVAKQTIRTQPRLAFDILGQETLAKIALKEGNVEVAEQIYEELEAQSVDAKYYLAQQAMIDSRWERAQRLIEDLLDQNPSDTLLRAELDKVIQAQQLRRTP